MITPDKTYSTNPFVDNIIYYAKLMALNCTIKDDFVVTRIYKKLH